MVIPRIGRFLASSTVMPMDTNHPWILNELKTMAIGMILVVFVVTEMDATLCKSNTPNSLEIPPLSSRIFH